MKNLSELLNGPKLHYIFLVDFEKVDDELIGDFVAENNSFVEPFQELWKKILGTLFYILQMLVGLILLAFIQYENEYGHFRTALNQLTSWKYLVVSNKYLELFINLKKKPNWIFKL